MDYLPVFFAVLTVAAIGAFLIVCVKAIYKDGTAE